MRLVALLGVLVGGLLGRPGPVRGAERPHLSVPPRVWDLPVPKRPLPDYDGRPPPPFTARDASLAVLRGILWPAHLAVESFVRTPIVGLTTLAEREHAVDWLFSFFTWDEGNAGLFPTFYYELGFRPSLGFFFYWDGMLSDRHDVRAHGGFWFDDWQQLAIEDRWALFADRRAHATLDARYLNRPDRLFHGIGSTTTEDDESRFRERLYEVRLRFTGDLGGLSQIDLAAAWRWGQFGRGEWPSIETRHDVADVPGFGRGYHLAEGRLRFVLDSRPAQPALTAGTGVRFEPAVSFAGDPGLPDLHFLRWSGELAGFLDLTGAGHVLGVRLYTEFVKATGTEPIPFTELPALGGLERHRGFPDNRFRGPSTFLLSFAYRYPVWAFLDAELFLSFGNAFDEYLSDFRPQRLHLATGIAIRSSAARSWSFDILLGFGTSRLDAPDVSVEGVHFAIGVNHGF